MITKNVNVGAHEGISIDGKTYFHVTKVEVFTGPDEETDCIELKSDGEKLKIARFLEHCQPSHCRIRGEIGVRIFLACEEDAREHILTLAHHKGSLRVLAEVVGE